MEDQAEFSELIVYGRNAVSEALKSDRSIDRIMVLDQEHQSPPINKIISDARSQNIVVRFESKEKMNQIAGTDKHQGIIALVAAYDYFSVEEILQDAKDKNESPFILILDQIEDPHNLGAIIRTAHIVGVHGIIIPKRRAVGLTSTVVKTSAGAIEYMKVARVTNISRTIEELKAKNIWVVCADMDGQMMYDVDMKGALAIIIGSEGEGVGRLVKEKADFIAKIPMKGTITSLNASVAAGVLLYEALRQRL
ncbi:MAG: 23S rRNA (guanosine(2251)-2'-O)-methyltransferase RlmB [Vallitaleaceae bacterium]|jgi:23S rRNA (guanosine2251-2'-O)-methyltransferase|nr:23S rRNA (guanosine(2251)-2'-O)-methyltransferase RlmB [Vallitaleaceae bacterium]